MVMLPLCWSHSQVFMDLEWILWEIYLTLVTNLSLSTPKTLWVRLLFNVLCRMTHFLLIIRWSMRLYHYFYFFKDKWCLYGNHLQQNDVFLSIQWHYIAPCWSEQLDFSVLALQIFRCAKGFIIVVFHLEEDGDLKLKSSPLFLRNYVLCMNPYTPFFDAFVCIYVLI